MHVKNDETVGGIRVNPYILIDFIIEIFFLNFFFNLIEFWQPIIAIFDAHILGNRFVLFFFLTILFNTLLTQNIEVQNIQSILNRTICFLMEISFVCVCVQSVCTLKQYDSVIINIICVLELDFFFFGQFNRFHWFCFHWCCFWPWPRDWHWTFIVKVVQLIFKPFSFVLWFRIRWCKTWIIFEMKQNKF